MRLPLRVFTALVLLCLALPAKAKAPRCGTALLVQGTVNRATTFLYRLLPFTPFANAREYARKKHAGHPYGAEPFDYHLGRIDEVLVRFGYGLGTPFDRHVRILGQLHDTLEDTDATYEELHRLFGRAIADDVLLLTFPPELSRQQGVERLAQGLFGRHTAVVGKLADRITNVEEGLFDLFDDGEPKWFRNYRDEWPLLREAMYPTSGDRRAVAMWNHLDLLFNDDNYAENFYLKQHGRTRFRGAPRIRWPREAIFFSFPLPDLSLPFSVRSNAILHARKMGAWP